MIQKYSKFQQMRKVNLAYRLSKPLEDQGIFTGGQTLVCVPGTLFFKVSWLSILGPLEYSVKFKVENESFSVKMEF